MIDFLKDIGKTATVALLILIIVTIFMIRELFFVETDYQIAFYLMFMVCILQMILQKDLDRKRDEVIEYLGSDQTFVKAVDEGVRKIQSEFEGIYDEKGKLIGFKRKEDNDEG